MYFNNSTFIRIATFHVMTGVFCASLQAGVYICVVQYSGAAYFSSGHLFFPLSSLGIICAIIYFCTAYSSIRLANQISLASSSHLPRGLVKQFRRLCVISLIGSLLLAISSVYLICLLAVWMNADSKLSNNSIVEVGQAALVLHVLHEIIAVLEMIVNGWSLWRTPMPQPRLTLTFHVNDGFAISGTPQGGSAASLAQWDYYTPSSRPSSVVSNW